MIVVEIAPGPESSGMASGTTAMLSLSSASFASSGVCCSPLVSACIIDIASRRMRIAPPTLNEAMVMPKNPSRCSPSSAETVNTMATETLATRAMRFLSATPCLAVRPRNIGIVPMGLTITSSAMKIFTYAAKSSMGEGCSTIRTLLYAWANPRHPVGGKARAAIDSAHDGSRARRDPGGLRAGHFDRLGPGFPVPAGAAGGALCRRRRHRYERARGRRPARGTPRPAGGGREPPGRLGQYRHRAGRKERAGRPHAGARLRRHDGDQSPRVREDPVRHVARFRARHETGRCDADPGRAPLGAGELAAGADRAGEGEAFRLRHLGHGWNAAPRRGDARAAHRRAVDARALQGRRPGDHRRARRADPARLYRRRLIAAIRKIG